MPLGTYGDSMSKYVMVDAVSQFRIRYVIEVPDNCGEDFVMKDGTRSFPTTPEEWAMDTVTCEEGKEFSQLHLGETIVNTREVTLGQAIAQYRKDEPVLGEAWDDQMIIKNFITRLEDQKDVFVE
jgi:hypothetical protein